MRITADTNIFLAVILEEPEKQGIVELTSGIHLIAPDALPYEIGNAIIALLKNKSWSKMKSSLFGKLHKKYPWN